MSILEACEYVGMGRVKFKSWADVIGAVVKRGRRVMFDKKIIDKAIRSEEMEKEKGIKLYAVTHKRKGKGHFCVVASRKKGNKIPGLNVMLRIF